MLYWETVMTTENRNVIQSTVAMYWHTPIEVLHTFLLGVIKYLWLETVSSLTSTGLQTFAVSTHRATEILDISPDV